MLWYLVPFRPPNTMCYFQCDWFKSFDICNLFHLFYYTPAPLKVEWGTLDSPWHPFVRPYICPSVCLFICRQRFRNVFKNLLAQFISYLAFTLMGWISWLLYVFHILASILAHWWPNIWPKNVVSRTFCHAYYLLRFWWNFLGKF